MAYKDLYNWVEKEKGIDQGKIVALKSYAYKQHCSDIQTLLENGICDKNDISRAVKDIYNLDTWKGNPEEWNPIKEIPIGDMVDEGFMIIKNPDDTNDVLLLLTKPTSKLNVVNRLGMLGIQGKINIKFIFYNDIDAWSKKNQTDINNQRLNAAFSNISSTKSALGSKYEVDAEEMNEESVVGTVNKIINAAIHENASDIHIEPFERSITIRFRIDGNLKLHSVINNKDAHQMIVNRIKVLAEMDTNNINTPQSGKINMEIFGKEVDMRVSTLPSVHGEKITIRILVSQNVDIKTLEELGFNSELSEQVRFLTAHPYGIILITGPTGSGKTSTLASILTEISNPEQNTVTIEDPVEYRIAGTTQVNVNEKVGLTFASVLREILRQDPDIIMIGEIRDTETARIAVNASNTGHLVFSTLHTNSAVSAITRLSDMGIEPYMVSDSLIGIISQRLVKVLCDNCKKPHVINNEDIRKFKLPRRMRDKTVYKSCGCPKCNKGYTGRTIVPEILEIDNNIREAIHNKESSHNIEKLALSNGMLKQLDYAYKLALEGKTSLNEVYKMFGGIEDEENDN